MSLELDLTFDFRSDTPPGKDPDALSPTLRSYHKQLWGRTLPSGQNFYLNDALSPKKAYLTHNSSLGDFELSSDSIIPTFTRWKRMQSIIKEIPENENEAFRSIGYTMGGTMLWPRRSTSGFKSINVMRGFNYQIADRMDLTLECVRRHYQKEANPLEKVLNANTSFFTIFKDFDGFVEHFLLQDLVDFDNGTIKFFMNFNNFTGSPRPTDLKSYIGYRENSIAFVHARNGRIGIAARSITPQDGDMLSF